MNKILTHLAGLLLLCFSVIAHADDPYKLIIPVQPTQTDNKIEVLEIFWYGCPHCYDFEPHIEKWLENLPEDVEFRRMPGIFNKNWIPHAKAYFTAEKLGVLDKIHSPLFNALHKERKRIYSEDELKDFFVAKGIDGDEFTKVFNSSEIETKFKQAFVMGQRYKITGVPAVIVNGKYMTSGSMTGSYENLLKTIEDLIAKERGE
ncbi:MAG: thiol:disulfide interchange protein DsbA/DsbL [Gammaproteobacteria bacterium]|jgi:protein dithiol oxidoreductase (disulfide-forming)|nr:thiol:disulfide interchange protein DsbA/DsbL [Gammaproteobacteria bacterium]